jgi:hypothetical protein
METIVAMSLWQLVDCSVDDLLVGDLEEFSGDFS